MIYEKDEIIQEANEVREAQLDNYLIDEEYFLDWKKATENDLKNEFCEKNEDNFLQFCKEEFNHYREDLI